MAELTTEQLEWCEQHLPKGKWKVNSQGLVDIEGNFSLRDKTLQRFPVSFGDVSDSFWCSHCTGLQSLEGAPRSVGGGFWCEGCTGLESLEGAPQRVGHWFSCNDCTGLETLEGVPGSVGEAFYCKGCTGLPEWVHSLANDFNEKEITWEELLQAYEKFLQKPKLGRAKNLGLF